MSQISNPSNTQLPIRSHRLRPAAVVLSAMALSTPTAISAVASPAAFGSQHTQTAIDPKPKPATKRPSKGRFLKPDQCISSETFRGGFRIAFDVKPFDNGDGIIEARVEKVANKWSAWNLQVFSPTHTATTADKKTVVISDQHKLFENPNYIGFRAVGRNYLPVIFHTDYSFNTHDVMIAFKVEANYAGKVKRGVKRPKLTVAVGILDFGFRSDGTKIFETWANDVSVINTPLDIFKQPLGNFKEVNRGDQGFVGYHALCR